MNAQNKINNLKNSNDVDLDYHYTPFGYIKLFLGGTATPSSIDVYTRDERELLETIEDKSVLDGLADGY